MRTYSRRKDPFDISGDVVRITLLDKEKQPHICLINLTDLPLVGAYHWRAKLMHKRYYAWTSVWQDGRIVTIQMHRLIAQLNAGIGTIDHRNGDGLDNQRHNLRLVPHCVNGLNRTSPHPLNTSGFRGVTYHKNSRKYKVQIGGERYGTYGSAQSANTVAATIYYLKNSRDEQISAGVGR